MSCINQRERVGGLISAPPCLKELNTTKPLRFGDDISWLSHCRVGDDQGQTEACAVFAIASWAEIVYGYDISDNECIDLYHRTITSLGRGDQGLSFSEAFAAAYSAGWLPGAIGLERVFDLQPLASQPVLAGYKITAAWDKVSKEGCLDHTADNSLVRDIHGVVIVAHGAISHLGQDRWVFIENSWPKWGWNGIGVLSEDLHRKLIMEMWIIR